MDEQEQNGVTVPSRAAMQFAQIPVKPPHNFLTAFRRKITLNVGNQINQYTEQHGDLNHIIEEELNAPTDSACCVQSQCAE